MIEYSELVQYIKDNHIKWDTDLFDVLRGFFESYGNKTAPQVIEQELIFEESGREFKEPENGEYSTQDLLDLFNT